MAKKKKLSREEATALRLENDLRDLHNRRFTYIPPVNVRYEVGQPVQLGNLHDVVVTEVLDEGKILKIEYTEWNNNYGHPIVTPGCQRYVSWIDLNPLVPEGVRVLTKGDDLRIVYQQRCVDGLFTMYYHGTLNMDPEYQRGLVWELEDKVALIRSIFDNVDIGKFTFAHLGFDKEYIYEVLDGKQRMNALIEFREGRFRFEGLTFHEMSRIDRNTIENHPISYGEIEEPTMAQKLELFLKVNTFGRPQDPAHIAKIKAMLEECV